MRAGTCRLSGRRSGALPGVLGACAALVVLAGLALPEAAGAQDRSTYVPTGLTSTYPTAHFVLHYNPSTPSPVAGMTIQQYVQAGAADFEESYGRLVSGGSGSPNAGLHQPTADSDGKTDVYLAKPLNKPTFSGGVVYADSTPLTSSYMFMTPDLARSGFRFRSAHEFMHVIQDAYVFRNIDGLAEGFANWASEWALPDVDPLDSNFYDERVPTAHPWFPLDCSFGTWEGTPCGNGYWQWLFVQAQVEDYGPDFVTGYLDRFVTVFGTPDTAVPRLLDYEINAQSAGAAGLRTRFDSYARDVWDPTRWTTNAIRRLDGEGTTPASYLYGVGDRDTGIQQVAIDHLAVRYVEVRNYPVYADPGDQVELTWKRPPGMAGPITPIIRQVGSERWVEAGSYPGDEETIQVDLGPTVDTIVLPLVNDSLTLDDQPFEYRVRMIDGPVVSAPRTFIGKHPPKHTAKRKARFSFGAKGGTGNTFECRLDKKRLHPCSSPVRVRVKPGKHVFLVVATDAAGNADRTPAKWRWKVTKG